MSRDNSIREHFTTFGDDWHDWDHGDKFSKVPHYKTGSLLWDALLRRLLSVQRKKFCGHTVWSYFICAESAGV